MYIKYKHSRINWYSRVDVEFDILELTNEEKTGMICQTDNSNCQTNIVNCNNVNKTNNT